MRIRALTALTATVLALVVPVGAAAPAAADRTPGDQPLPGYTIEKSSPISPIRS